MTATGRCAPRTVPPGRKRSPGRNRRPFCGWAVSVPLALAGIGGPAAVLAGLAGVSHAQSILAAPGGAPGPVEQLINDGDLEQAETELAARMESQGETSRNLLLRGILRYRRERYQQALVDLKRSFALDESDPSTSKALGLCLVKLGREDLAETFFEIATELAPADFWGHYYLGLNRYTTKRFELAVPPFERALALRPGSIDAHCFLGRSQEALGEIEGARRLYAAAVDLNRMRPSPSGEPPLLLGGLLFRQQQLDRAEALLLEALGHDSNAALAHYWLGLLREQRSDLRGAMRSLAAAAERAPSDHRPHYALARIYRRIGDRVKAGEAVRRFRELRRRSESETY